MGKEVEINPLISNISMYILHTVLHTFSMVMMRRNFQTIKLFISYKLHVWLSSVTIRRNKHWSLLGVKGLKLNLGMVRKMKTFIKNTCCLHHLLFFFFFLGVSWIFEQESNIIYFIISMDRQNVRGLIRSRQPAKTATYFVRIYLSPPPTLSRLH